MRSIRTHSVQLPAKAAFISKKDNRLYVAPYTCAEDGAEHLVTDEAYIAGRRAGVVRAACGHRVLMAAAVSESGAPCQRCHYIYERLRPQALSPAPPLTLPTQRWPLRFALRKGKHAR